MAKGLRRAGCSRRFLPTSKRHCLDRRFHGPSGPARWANARLIRYADDFVILARYQGQRLTDWVEERGESWLELRLNREKTRTVDLNEAGSSLDFLGFTFRPSNHLYGGGRR